MASKDARKALKVSISWLLIYLSKAHLLVGILHDQRDIGDGIISKGEDRRADWVIGTFALRKGLIPHFLPN